MWKARPFNSDDPDPFGKGPKKTEEQLTAESSKCPSCASNIFYMPEVRGLVCRNCGNIYQLSTLEVIGSLGYSIEHDYTGDNDISEDDKKRHEIVCDSCGATMIADENMMSTMCPFCGSPALITRRMTREFKPDYIIPFKIDKQTAGDNIKKWLKTRKMTPRGFKTKSRLTKMTPLYVPFWVLDCAVNTDLYGVGKIYKDKVGSVFSVKTRAKYYVKGVPFDASLKIANKLMEAIEPFDYSEMVKFDNRYLQGFCADKYDQPPTEIMGRIIKRLDKISLDLSDTVAAKYHDYVPEPQKNFTWMSELNIKYCLLPVWFMTVEFNGRSYQFAVNGQTGEASGQAPTSSAVDKLDRFRWFTRSGWRWLPVIAAVVLPPLIGLITMTGNLHPFVVAVVYLLCFIELLLIVFSIGIRLMHSIADRTSRRIHTTVDAVNDFDKAPGMDAYLDSSRGTKLNVDDFLVRREYDKEDERDKEDI